MQTSHPLRTAICGLGYRGKRFVELLTQMEHFQLIGGYDPNPDNRFQFPVYSGEETAYLQLLQDLHPELVIIASPWDCHIRQAIQAMKTGSHVALEIRGGIADGEYAPLQTIRQKNKVKVFPLENTLFMQETTAAIQAVHEGLLGEIVALKGGYRHDLRDLLISPDGTLGNPHKPEGSWRSSFYRLPDADIYPTHGVAPLAAMIGINRDDHFRQVTAVRSKAAGIKSRLTDMGTDANIPVMGDLIVTHILTEKEVLITLTHDTTLPRPRSLDFEIQGTKGIWKLDEHKIYLEGISPLECWEDDTAYIQQYKDPIWRKWGEKAQLTDSHHNGMDYIMLLQIALDLSGEYPYPATLTDLETWTSLTLHSRRSIQERRTIRLF